MLTSTKNPRIQHIRKLQNSSRFRRKEKRFVVEGIRLVEEALNAAWQPELVLFTEDIGQRGHKILNGFRKKDVEILPVASQVMQAVSDTQTPQGILAVIPIRNLPAPKKPVFILILDGLRDPGNLGAILRTACAAGVDTVWAPPGTVDLFSPKVIRAGMGAHFWLPTHALAWDGIEAQLTGLSIFLADSAAGQPYYQSDFESPLALIIGGEAAGAGESAQKLATHRVHIPMPGKSESLNAAVAAAVLMFEVVRQRQSQ